MKRGGVTPATPSRELALLRLHYRVPVLENIRYRLALLRGKRYRVKPEPWATATYTPGPESERLSAEEYDPTLDPWEADSRRFNNLSPMQRSLSTTTAAGMLRISRKVNINSAGPANAHLAF